MAGNSISIEPMSGAIGAEILGIDLASPITDQMIEEIRKAQLDHFVVFFRDQDITPQQHLAFAKRFGEVLEYPLVKGLEDIPQIAPVIKLAHETVNFGGVWHSDTAYLPEPPKATMLVARELPPYGGDTMFANMYKAYETLSDGLKSMLEGLRAVNSTEKADASATREDRLKTSATAAASEEIASAHPVVRTHPETGRKLLYVNAGHTTRFENMTVEESAPLLNYLFQHQIQPEFTCRFRWQPGSIAFWDNRAAQHNPINDYHGFKRVMHRVTLAGDAPS
ncbi:MAG: TauD/TfdA family dioxygenase [Roseovarius sp.]|nr:TauD/TfdA family dioxygenase [Roseovarius sp.]